MIINDLSSPLNWNVQALLVRLNVSGLEMNNNDCSFEHFVVINMAKSYL
jgi:hypothetical protein